MHQFQEAWARFEPQENRNVLEGDELLLEPEVVARHVTFHSWQTLINDPQFWLRNTRLHLSLLPQPFFGDLSQARIFILALNPGVGPTDYFAEFCMPEYKRAAIDTLKQQINSQYPFIWFDPRFSWHSGFSYWHGRFAALIDLVAGADSSRAEALSLFARSVATVELLPYHSVSYGLPGRIITKLRSVQLAQAFVSEILVPRARRGEVVLIAARQGSSWRLPEHPNIIVYRGSETRAAYLTPRSRGGQAILRHLHAA